MLTHTLTHALACVRAHARSMHTTACMHTCTHACTCTSAIHHFSYGSVCLRGGNVWLCVSAWRLCVALCVSAWRQRVALCVSAWRQRVALCVSAWRQRVALCVSAWRQRVALCVCVAATCGSVCVCAVATQEGDGISPTAIREIMLLRELRHANVVRLDRVHINRQVSCVTPTSCGWTACTSTGR